MISVTHDGVTVETNTGTEADIRANLGMEREAVDAGETLTAADTESSGSVSSAELPDAGADGASAPEPVAATPEPAAPGKGKKPRDNPQARIAQVLEQKRLADQRAQAAEARIAALEAQLNKPVPPVAPLPGSNNGNGARPKPKEDEVGTKYASYADFVEDLADWKAEQRLGKVPNVDQLVDAKLAQREQQREWQRQAAAHQARVDTAKTTYADYQERVDASDTALAEAGLALSPAVSEAILSSDRSADLVYYLATHPDELLQLAKDARQFDASAAPLIRSMLDARLGAVASSGSAPRASSTAKPPIKPVGASPVTPGSDDSDDEPFDAYFKRMNARDRKAGKL
jgi:hypothetical protein